MNGQTDSPSSTALPPLPPHWFSLAHAFLHQARSQPHVRAVADSSGAKLTYRQLLVASIALANQLNRTLADDFNTVGILLPPSVGAVIANIGVVLLGKVPVNLNYSSGQRQFDAALVRSEVKHIISSSRVLDRLKIECNSNVIKLEDVQEDISLLDKITAWSEAELLPSQLLSHLLHGLLPQRTTELPESEAVLQNHRSLPANRLHDPATIIFTSGSTGDPKGVVLTHSNILSNIHAINLQGHVQPGEIVLGVIPFFHSFGFTITLWAPLCLGETAVYHYDPLDGRKIGDMCHKFQASMLVSTPTMMASYLRRCSPSRFASLSCLVIGGEKLHKKQALEIESKLGCTPLEGYGLAETSPVISCNVSGAVVLPDGRTVAGTKLGTVGRPLPGTSLQIVDCESGLAVAPGEEGMILIKGPQVMMGYFANPATTARVIKDGWFTTGDLGFIDGDGFLTITGRLSQFSKIAGEMVPHLAVEEEITKISGCAEQSICVTSMPDEKRGERLIVVYTELCGMSPERVVSRLRASNIAPLWIPDASDFIFVKEMPVLRNGKMDLLAIKQIAASSQTSEQKIDNRPLGSAR